LSEELVIIAIIHFHNARNMFIKVMHNFHDSESRREIRLVFIRSLNSQQDELVYVVRSANSRPRLDATDINQRGVTYANEITALRASDDRWRQLYPNQWRSQKFSTGGALNSGLSSYPHNPLLIYLIHYVTKYFIEK